MRSKRILVVLAVLASLVALACVALVTSYSMSGLPVYQGF